MAIGANLRGRDHLPGLDSVAGPFRNIVPLRLTIDERETVAGFLGRAERTRRSVIEHEYAPEALIREWAAARRPSWPNRVRTACHR